MKTARLGVRARCKGRGVSNQDVEFLNLPKYQVSDIARIFGVRPHTMKDIDRATFKYRTPAARIRDDLFESVVSPLAASAIARPDERENARRLLLRIPLRAPGCVRRVSAHPALERRHHFGMGESQLSARARGLQS